MPNSTSACSSFSPPRLDVAETAGHLDRDVLAHDVARLVEHVAVDQHFAGHNQALRLRARLRQPARHDKFVKTDLAGLWFLAALRFRTHRAHSNLAARF